MRIAHLADLHLGYRAYHRTTKGGVNQREYDVAVAFKETIDKLLELEPDVTVVAGDLFHTVRPPNAIVNFAFREIQRLHANNKSIIMVAGNHESPKSKDTGCILELFHRIDDGKRIRVAYNEPMPIDMIIAGQKDRIHILCVPHNAVLRRPHLEPDPDADVNVLLIHAASNEYVPQARHGGQILRAEEIKPEQWDYVALGDYHTYTVVAPNMIYPGAIERCSNDIWREATEPKGFVIYDTDTREHEFIELKSPRPVFDLGPYHGSGMNPEELDAFIEQELSQVPIDGALVRLKILDVERSIARDLNRKRIAEWKARALHLHLDLRQPTAREISLPAANGGGRPSLVEEFAAFVKEKFGEDDDHVKQLVELGQKYLEQAEEEDRE